MNYYAMEFLARERMAELRREAHRPRSEPTAVTTSPSPQERDGVVRRLVSWLLVARLQIQRHG
jgi:hypothetical protein